MSQLQLLALLALLVRGRLCEFPLAAVTNGWNLVSWNHKPISQCCWSEVYNWWQLSPSTGSRKHFLAFLEFRSCPHSLAHNHVTSLTSVSYLEGTMWLDQPSPTHSPSYLRIIKILHSLTSSKSHLPYNGMCSQVHGSAQRHHWEVIILPMMLEMDRTSSLPLCFRCCHRTDVGLIIYSVALFKSKQQPFAWFTKKNQWVWIV